MKSNKQYHSISSTFFIHCAELASGLFLEVPDVFIYFYLFIFRNVFVFVWWQMLFEIAKYVIAGFAISNQEMQFSLNLHPEVNSPCQAL